MAAPRLRPAGPADVGWGFRLYEDLLRAPTLASVGHWSAPQRAVIEAAVASGHAQVIVAGDEDVGWLHVVRQPDHIVVHQLLVARPWQGRGLATALLGDLLDEGRVVRLVVMHTNHGALRLYRRLGFAVRHTDRVRHYLVWTPPAPPR